MPAAAGIGHWAELLESAAQPLVIVGGSGWSEDTRIKLQNFCAANALALVNSFRCQDYIDNEHPSYIGDLGIGVNPALVRRIKASDCLLVIGARLGEMTTGGVPLIDIPRPPPGMVSVHPGAEETGTIYQPDPAV